jgi:polyisoprenoid-binding protein YceI
MRVALFTSIIAGCLLIAGCGHLLPAQHQTLERTELEGGAFALDPDHATIHWKVDHLGFSQFVGRFDRFDARLDFDPEAPEESSLEVVVDTGSVSTHVPGFAEELRGSSWLDTERHPEARFVSRAISVTGPDSGTVTGDLTLLGTTRPVTLDITFNGGASNLVTGRYTLGFAATTVIDRTAFGLTTLAPAIGSDVTLEIHAEFVDTRT